MNKIHIHLTITLEEAQWLLELLLATDAETSWGIFFHKLAIRLEKLIIKRS